MNIVLKNALVDYYLTCKWSSGILDESICLLAPRKDVGSLAVTSERDELQLRMATVGHGQSSVGHN